MQAALPSQGTPQVWPGLVYLVWAGCSGRAQSSLGWSALAGLAGLGIAGEFHCAPLLPLQALSLIILHTTVSEARLNYIFSDSRAG